MVVLRRTSVGMTVALAMRQHEMEVALVGDERDRMSVVAAMDPERQQPREEGGAGCDLHPSASKHERNDQRSHRRHFPGRERHGALRQLTVPSGFGDETSRL